MTIEESAGYKSSKKSIKSNHESLKMLNAVLSHIAVCKCRQDLKNNPVSNQYGYEELKGDLSGYNRFSLCKNAHTGKTRLIFSFVDENTIRLEYISNNHYEDFKRYLRKVGDKHVAC